MDNHTQLNAPYQTDLEVSFRLCKGKEGFATAHRILGYQVVTVHTLEEYPALQREYTIETAEHTA